MSEFLVIRLDPPAPDSARWMLVDETGQVLQTGTPDLSEAAAHAGGNKIIGLAPAPDILRAAVDLPVSSRAKQLQALPFAMEEQLAEEVELLHFAAGRAVADDPLPVAVVRKDRLSQWREELQAADLDPTALYSEADAMDELPGTGVLFLEQGRAVLRDSNGQAVCADPDSTEAIVQLWLVGAREAATGANLLVYLAGDCEAEMRPRLEALRSELATLEIKLLENGLLSRLATIIAARPGINLLQGEFASRSNLGKFWPQWRMAAALLVAVAITMTGVKAAEVWRLDREAAGLRQAVEKAFRYVFPDVRNVRADVRAQFESQMRALGEGQSTDSGVFLETLQVVATAVRAGAGTQLESVDYRSGVMELRLRAPDVETLDKIQREIISGGRFNAEIQSANADNDQVLGRLRISVRGA
jgi:general secretion pathway protein L